MSETFLKSDDTRHHASGERKSSGGGCGVFLLGFVLGAICMFVFDVIVTEVLPRLASRPVIP